MQQTTSSPAICGESTPKRPRLPSQEAEGEQRSRHTPKPARQYPGGAPPPVGPEQRPGHRTPAQQYPGGAPPPSEPGSQAVATAELSQGVARGPLLSTADMYIERYAAAHVPPPTAPREVGVFSMDANRVWHGDGRGLRIYQDPAIGADLVQGFHPQLLRDRDARTPERLNSLLKWIQANPVAAALERHQVVSYRGTITRIMCCPYENRAPLQVRGCWGDVAVVFMCVV